MKIICAWCGEDLGEKDPLDDKRISHGICPECKTDLLGEVEKRLLREARDAALEEPMIHPLFTDILTTFRRMPCSGT
jgi:hypothetical protein